MPSLRVLVKFVWFEVPLTMPVPFSAKVPLKSVNKVIFLRPLLSVAEQLNNTVGLFVTLLLAGSRKVTMGGTTVTSVIVMFMCLV